MAMSHVSHVKHICHTSGKPKGHKEYSTSLIEKVNNNNTRSRSETINKVIFHSIAIRILVRYIRFSCRAYHCVYHQMAMIQPEETHEMQANRESRLHQGASRSVSIPIWLEKLD